MLIQIIAILAAMLLPALNKARESAKGASCLSNLKNQGLAMRMYCDEYGNYFPSVGKPGSASFRGWAELLVEGKYAGADTGGSISFKQFQCPSDNVLRTGTSVTTNRAEAERRKMSYAGSRGIYAYMCGWWNTTLGITIKDTKVKKPSNFIVVGENAYFDSFIGNSNRIAMDLVTINSLHNRIMPKNSNFLLGDGHSEYIPYDLGSTDYQNRWSYTNKYENLNSTW